MNEDLVKRLVAESDIRQILASYSQGVDRKDWNLLRSAYHDDAIDNHGAFNGHVDGLIAWIRNRHENVVSSMHMLCNISIDFKGQLNLARVETYCLAFQLSDAEAAKVLTPNATRPMRQTVAVRYIDDFEYRDGPGWRIKVRNVVYEWVKVESDENYSTPSPDWQVFRRDQSDALYVPLQKSSDRST